MSTPLKGLVIGRSSGRCAATDRELVPGEACFTALVRPVLDPEAPASDRPVFDRLDFDPDHWESTRTSGDLDDRLLCWWRTEVPEPGGRKNLFVDDETLVDLFARLEEETDDSRLAFRFVLGLILLRRRKIRVVDRSREGEDDVWRFKKVGGGEDAPIWSVADPRLSEDDAEAIADQLSTILSDEG